MRNRFVLTLKRYKLSLHRTLKKITRLNRCPLELAWIKNCQLQLIMFCQIYGLIMLGWIFDFDQCAIWQFEGMTNGNLKLIIGFPPAILWADIRNLKLNWSQIVAGIITQKMIETSTIETTIMLCRLMQNLKKHKSLFIATVINNDTMPFN